MTHRAGRDELEVVVPGHRSYDTLREVDLIEEVARTHGFDAFPEVMSAAAGPAQCPDHPLFQLEDTLRRTLLAADGISEAQTPALGPARHGDVPSAEPDVARGGIPAARPVSPDCSRIWNGTWRGECAT